MIIRLTQKLAKKVNVTGLKEKPLEEGPIADWSANLFIADRTQYIILVNTKSFYAIVMEGRGINDDNQLISRARSGISEAMEYDGLIIPYMEHLVASKGVVQFAKTLNSSVTGSITDHIQTAKYLLLEEDYAPFHVGLKINDTPLASLSFAKPIEVIRQLTDEWSSTHDSFSDW